MVWADSTVAITGLTQYGQRVHHASWAPQLQALLPQACTLVEVAWPQLRAAIQADPEGTGPTAAAAAEALPQEVVAEPGHEMPSRPLLPSKPWQFWTVYDRLVHLGYDVEALPYGKRGPRLRISRLAGKVLRARHGGNPERHSCFDGDARRCVLLVNDGDLNCPDAAIQKVLGPPPGVTISGSGTGTA